MYKCQNCQRLMPAGTKSFRVPVEFRPKHYPPREDINWVKRHGRAFWRDDNGGDGYEIVREITACPDCAPTIKPITLIANRR